MNTIFVVIGNGYKFEGVYNTLKNAYAFVESYFDSDNFCDWEIQEMELKANGTYHCTTIYDYSNIRESAKVK